MSDTITSKEITENTSLISKGYGLVSSVYAKLDMLSPLGNLALRLWVANVFFKSGMTKIKSWDSTLYLFEEEYAVPVIPPEFAAMIGTAVELFFPVLLVLGLAARFSAITLFIFNIMAVISYPDLNAAGIRDHQVWGVMLLIPLLMGPGKLSLDNFINKKFGGYPY